MSTVHLRVATRQSALALAQTQQLVEQLERTHSEMKCEIVKIVTEGDRRLDRSLADIGGKGLFIKEIELALQDNQADFAIHSLKDLPATMTTGFTIVCVPPREDARDVIITHTEPDWMALRAGAVIGTGSFRRVRQIERLRSDLTFQPIRGNIDTRLRKLAEGHYDAVVLAAAGMKRLGVQPQHAHPLQTVDCVPSAGQGALAIEIAESKQASRWASLLTSMQDDVTRICVEAERACVAALGGDCTTPVGIYAERESSNRLGIRAFLAATGSQKFASLHDHFEMTWQADAPSFSRAVECGKYIADRLQAALEAAC